MAKDSRSIPLTGLIIGLLVLALCLGLAVWQWQRAGETRDWLARERQKAASPPVSLERALAMSDRQHQPVRLRGHIDNAHPVLLDNRTWQGRVGYDLLSPLRTDSGHWVLLDRGWLPAGAYRDRLPPIPRVDGEAIVTGTVYRPSHNIFIRSDADTPADQWPLRVPEADFAAIGARLGVELAPFEIRLGPDQRLGDGKPLPRPWKEVEAAISPARHIAYAIQWVAIGIAGLLVFVLAGRRRARRRRERQQSND